MAGPNRELRECISWDEFFMETAILAAKRSKDPKKQVGACIANSENRIVGFGYNGTPNGWNDRDFPWDNERKHSYVCHAELNAIVKKYSDLTNSVIYVTLFPCHHCAKIIVQSGIKKVVYKEIENGDRDSIEDSKVIFEHAGIVYIQY